MLEQIFDNSETGDLTFEEFVLISNNVEQSIKKFKKLLKFFDDTSIALANSGVIQMSNILYLYNLFGNLALTFHFPTCKHYETGVLLYALLADSQIIHATGKLNGVDLLIQYAMRNPGYLKDAFIKFLQNEINIL